jgi:type IX secretion system substrate protein
MKRTTYLMLFLVATAVAEPDSTATADLRTIAQTCLSDGGRAVLGARGLSKVVLKEYYDDNNCQQPQGRSAEPNDRELTKAFVIVPNPANQEVSIRLEAPVIDTGELQVVTLQGQLMHRATLGDNQQEILIHTSNWPAGIYLVKLHDKEGTQVRTLVIQH